VLAALASPPAASAQETGDLRSQFQAVIDDLNANSWSGFHDAVDEDAFLGRVFGYYVLENEPKQFFASNFRQQFQNSFLGAFPLARTQDEASAEIIGTLVAFQEDRGQARAIVRYAGEGFRYSYHSYDLILGRGGKVQIVDWWDYYQGKWFSQHVADSLVRILPTRQAVAGLLEMPNPGEGRLFQVGELLKTLRDGNLGRYFEIYDGLEEALRQEPFIVMLNFGRLLAAAAQLAETFPGDARFSLPLAEFYIQARRFEDAIVELDRFEDALGIDDGVVRVLKATAEMALGDFENAQADALSATEAEPELELAWWTLLRTRTAAENYEGATEALSVLEDRFGHLLIPQKLRRDRFLRVLIDQQEYKDWRAARDAA
jgi:hypothetical protein